MVKKTAKAVSLALQGGGHGAFTWGALDYRLEHDFLQIGAVSGTSVDAMNTVVLADGYFRSAVVESWAQSCLPHVGECATVDLRSLSRVRLKAERLGHHGNS